MKVNKCFYIVYLLLNRVVLVISSLYNWKLTDAFCNAHTLIT